MTKPFGNRRNTIRPSSRTTSCRSDHAGPVAAAGNGDGPAVSRRLFPASEDTRSVGNRGRGNRNSRRGDPKHAAGGPVLMRAAVRSNPSR